MKNKDDWKKLEIWADDRRREEIRKYGIDITKEQNTKKVELFSKTLNKTWDIVFRTVCILIFIIVIYLLSVYVKSFNELNRKLDVDIIREMKGRYSVEFVSDGQELDANGNGIYLLSNKENRNIKFSVIKKGQEIYDDYCDKSLKYCFDNWKSEYKSIFNVEEYTKENGLLSYTLYANANNFSEINKILDAYFDLKNGSEKYLTYGNIKIRDGEYVNNIFSNLSREEIENDVKRHYVIWHKDNNYNIDNISKEDIEKYYKPSSLNVYINGRIVKFGDMRSDLTSSYFVEKDSYGVSLYAILENINIETQRNEKDYIKSFVYNGKTYYNKLEGSIPKDVPKEYIIENVMLYVDDIERIFETKVKIDYQNRRMDIEIK